LKLDGTGNDETKKKMGEGILTPSERGADFPSV